MTLLQRATDALKSESTRLSESRLPDEMRDFFAGREDEGWRCLVRAVLTAIREPSNSMQSAAFAQKVSFRSGSGMSDIGQVSVECESEPDRGAATLWRVMIDAALAEGG